MRDSNQSLAQRWLDQASHDLEAAQWNAKGQFWANSCFFSQQASEKALKAYCYARGEREVLGHSLLVLSRRCSAYDADFASIEPECRRLDKYYVTSRYPNGLPDGTPAEWFDHKEAEDAMAFARGIVTLVDAKLTTLFGKGDR